MTGLVMSCHIIYYFFGLTGRVPFVVVVSSLPFYLFVCVRVYTLTFFSISLFFLSFLYSKNYVPSLQSQETSSSRRFTLEAKWGWHQSFGHF